MIVLREETLSQLFSKNQRENKHPRIKRESVKSLVHGGRRPSFIETPFSLVLLKNEDKINTPK